MQSCRQFHLFIQIKAHNVLNTCFVMCGFVYVLVLLCVGVLVIRVLVFTVFCIVCTVFFVLFRLCILYVLPVLV